MSSATYVYCVVGKTQAKTLGRAPKGLAGADKPRFVDAGEGYRLVVATVPLELYAGEAIEEKLRDLDWVGARAGEHEAVVEHATKIGTVVPMKLFTLFSSDERAAAHVKKMKRTLDRAVERIEGCDEWGLRVLFDEARARRAAEAERPVQATSGTSFLLRKKAQEAEKRTLAVKASGEVEELYERLAKASRQAHKRAAPSRELAGRVLLDAVFLVPQAHAKKFTATVSSSAKGLSREGVEVTLTGPWPAYSFIGGP